MTTDLGQLPGGDREKVVSRYTEVFFATGEDDPDRPLLLVQHIQKTAGTALRALIRDNLPPAERSVGNLRQLRDRSREELLRWYGEYWRDLAPERRAAVCCVMAHSANYLLPAIERPVDAITLVRDPVDRVVSQWYFPKDNRGKAPEASGNPLPEHFSYKRPHSATLGDVFRQLGGAGPRDGRVAYWYSRFFNGQSRSLLAPHHDVDDLPYSQGPPPDADLWRERLFTLVDERYQVGVQECFAEFAQLLSARYGWRAWVPEKKVNRARPALAELPAGMADSVRGYNWLDHELHGRYARRAAAA